MASVVIIHASEDALPARALAEKLRLSGFAPLVDQVGKDGFRDALRSAASIVTLWSPRSTDNAELIEEAQFAQGIRPLLHIRMQNAPNPAPFANDNSIDLTGWRGEDEFPAWRDALKAVARDAGVPEPAMPARTASPFFQPGAARPLPGGAGPLAAVAPDTSGVVRQMPARPVQRATPAHLAAEALSQERLAPIRPLSDVSLSPYASPSAQRGEAYAPVEPKSPSGGGKLALIGGITFLVVAGVGLGGYFAWDRFQAGQSADAAWTTIDTSDASELQTFLSEHEGSSHDGEAHRRLAALDEEAYRHARSADTVEGFQRYVSEFPDGENVLAARGRIAELQQMPSTATGLNPALDPATGLPIDPTAPLGTENPDLVPPGSDLTDEPTSLGPVPLAPPPTNAPAAAPQEPGPGPTQLGPVQ